MPLRLRPSLVRDRRRLCNNQLLTFQLSHILPHGVDTHADSFADRPVAGPALIGLAVLTVEQAGVDRQRARRQTQRKNLVGQRKESFGCGLCALPEHHLSPLVIDFSSSI